jgi:putative addiction module killer protein
MLRINETEAFADWMNRLRDARAKAKIASRIDRLRFGNPGDVAPVGEGVSEMKINYGPGYRVYYATRGRDLVILLCGGDKATQDRDIKRAKAMAAELQGRTP